MKMLKFSVILLALLLISMPVFADCLLGWFCKDTMHRGYRDCTCNWSFIELCQFGCLNGQCSPAPNQPPTIPIVEVIPNQPTASNDLICHAESTDPNAYQNIEYTYKWYKDTEYYTTKITTANTTTLDSAHTSQGETWKCMVRAYDQTNYSNYGYDQVTVGGGTTCNPGWKCKDCCIRAYQNADCSWINEEACINGCLNGACVGSTQNHQPSDPNLYISPGSPNDNDDLTCYAYSTDQDNDTLTYHFTWYQDNHVFRTYSTQSHTDRIDDSHTDEGEEWRCKARAWDGEDYSGYTVDTVIIGQGSCAFSIDLDPEHSTIHMERNDIESVRVEIENTSCEHYCVDLYGRDTSSYIDADPARDRVCLNPGERTWVALTIETMDASARTYTVKMEAKRGSSSRSASINVIVDSCTGCGSGCTTGCGSSSDCLALSTYSRSICRDSKENLRVKVRNTSNEIKTVELSASSSEFLATFEEDEIELDAHSEKYVDLEVYVYNDTSLGSHYVNVYAETDGDYVSRKAYFTVTDCEEPEENSFSLSVSSGCTSVDKGKDRNVSFTVKNKTGNDLTVNLQTVAGIPTEVQSEVHLNAHESKTVKVMVSARNDDEPGRHYVKLYGWTAKYRLMKTFCVDIDKRRDTVLTLTENNLDIEQCKNEIFVLVIENRGDYNEDYEIEISNSTGANITLSDDDFDLDAGKAKEIFVNVDVPLDMETGDYHFDVLVKNTETFTKRVYFTVIKAVEPLPSTLELATYPSKIVLVPGEIKTISVSLANLTNDDIDGIELEWSLPPFAYTPDSTIEIKGGERLTIEQEVSLDPDAIPGTYYGTLSMKFDGYEVTKKVALVVVEPETIGPGPGDGDGDGEDGDGAGFAPFVGLFTLGQSWGIGLIILLIIVIIMVALKGIIESDTDYSKPLWHRR